MKRITIGIPTYNRPAMLARALRSVVAQDYPNLHVIVADNASQGAETAETVRAFERQIPGLEYHRHEQNTGPLSNFQFLLDHAEGTYFMWLADDDEITPNYVTALATELDADPDLASAVARWVLVTSEGYRRPMRNAEYTDHSALRRVVRFIWGTDDTFFYALHRTEVLREATFEGYWWPNCTQTANWAYVFLLDVVLRGRTKLVSDGAPEFINHGYTSKAYAQGPGRFRGLPGRVVRRLNVHALYWRKCVSVLGARSLLAVIPISVAALARETVEWARWTVAKRVSGSGQ